MSAFLAAALSEAGAADGLPWQRLLVSLSGLVYWGGVLVQARRVRRRIGRTPNLKPKGAKERLLWIGWTLVVLGWILQPLWLRGGQASPLGPIGTLVHPAAWSIGAVLVVGGYLATLWCYAAMGAAWRIGIDKGGTSELVQSGPYRRIRHPIYSFQMAMLLGAALLLPTAVSIALLVLHFVCASIKASDEERHLVGVFGDEYRDYLGRTGRFLPK
jgi:protein-S-isoprenylcysteine O-methyltransferase Ste14